MSPVNDDVIFFVVLAAGLRPVQAPLDPHDGSIDLAAVPDSLWPQLSGVLTTNLYGSPDPAPELRTRCDELGIPLIEDAAHAIGSEAAGRKVGGYGEAAVFSLSKHTAAKAGGFLATADPGLREALAKARDELLAPPRASAELAYWARPYAEATVRGLRLAPAAWAVLRMLGQQEREDIRMALRPGDLRRALDTAPGLAAFHSWVRVDMHDYRASGGRLRLGRVAGGSRAASTPFSTRTARAPKGCSPPSGRGRSRVGCSRCSGCRCSSRTGTRPVPHSPASGSPWATCTTLRSTTTRARPSPTPPPRRTPGAGSPSMRCPSTR